MNIAMKAYEKNFRREMVKNLFRGPGTGMFFSVWKASFSAIVTRDAGHTQL
jgi:hypothetical protein